MFFKFVVAAKALDIFHFQKRDFVKLPTPAIVAVEEGLS
jgi:hypothetical protein